MSLISDIWHYLQRRPCVRVTWDAKYERRPPAPGATPVVWDTEWLVSFQICDIVSTPVTLKRVAIRCWWKGAAPGPWRVYGVGEDERVSKDYPYRSNPPVHMSLVEIQDEWEPSAYLELEVKYSDGFFRREAWGFKAKCSQNDAMELVIDGETDRPWRKKYWRAPWVSD